MRQQYLRLGLDGAIECSLEWDSPDVGPTYPLPPGAEGSYWVPTGAEFSRAGRGDTEVAYLVDGQVVWTDRAPLVDVIARGINVIDGAAGAARLAVISQQTNMPEYERAERHAREYKAAGYPADDVPRAVAGWVAAKHRENWTARQAADDIIATADAWIELLDGIRDMRLAAKEDVRHASDSEEVAARVQRFSADLTNLMKGTS